MNGMSDSTGRPRSERRRQRLHVVDAEHRREAEAEEQDDEAGRQLVGAAASTK